MKVTQSSSSSIVEAARVIFQAYHAGKLGGTSHEEYPDLSRDSRELRLYFTLAPALNYQRRSELLWRAAKMTFDDSSTRFVFEPANYDLGFERYQRGLVRYRLALQPAKQTQVWLRLSETLATYFQGDPLNLFAACDRSVASVREYVRSSAGLFPYLRGKKLFNYWLYMIDEFTSVQFVDRREITIIPDLHVRRASVALGVVDAVAAQDGESLSLAWNEALASGEFDPVDLHAPLWRWSRAGMPDLAKLRD